MTIQHTPPVHRAYQGTYWNAFKADSECKLPEIIHNRNIFADQMFLKPWKAPSSWVYAPWFQGVLRHLDHAEFYKAASSPVVLWHDYHTNQSDIDFWVKQGFSVLPHMYSKNTVSYGIHFRDKRDMESFFKALFLDVKQETITGALVHGFPLNQRFKGIS